MATYDLTKRVQNKYFHSQDVLSGGTYVVSAVFDGAQAAAVKGSALAVNDVFQLINVPVGAVLLTITHTVSTTEGGICTYSIGDGTSTAGCVSGANGNTATDATSINATPTALQWKYYSAADTLDLLLATGTAAAVVIKISATFLMTRPNAV